MSSAPFIDQLRQRGRRRREATSENAQADQQVRVRNDLLPKLELVLKPIAKLRPHGRNARPPAASHIREVANSISALGFCDPVLIDQDGCVIDGWVSVLAGQQVGLQKVPCIVVSHLNAAERRLLRLALNRLGEKGSWDVAELKLELGELILEDVPLEISGFSDIEIDLITLDEEPPATEAGPLAPDAALEPIAKPGDIYALGRHRVACGDARDPELLKRLTAGTAVRLVLTDVPYNVRIKGNVTGGDHREFAMASGEMSAEQYLAFNEAWIAAAMAVLIDGGVLGTFIDWRGLPTINAAATDAGLDPLNLVVWSKPNPGMGSLYRSAHELLPLFKKGSEPHVNNISLGRHGRSRSNVWSYAGASSMGSDARKGLKDHPTVKPTAMLEDALLDLTQRGDTVLDPFLGSGSMVIAAEKAGRICVGVEIDPLYVDVAIRRFEAATGNKAKLIESTTRGEEVRKSHRLSDDTS